MPIYEYKCLDCDSHFERMQKSSEEPLKVCEKCGGNLEKQWSLSGFQFKGAGWYVTDYSNKLKDGSGKDEKTGKTSTPEKSSTGESNREKSSTGESTVKAETASNKPKDTVDAKKDTVSKKE